MADWPLFWIRRPWLTLGLALLLALASLRLAESRLQFSADRSLLLDAQDPVRTGWEGYRRRFGPMSDYLLLVQGDDEESARGAVELLGKTLGQNPGLEHVFYRLDLPEIGAHALYFLKRPALEQLSSLMSEARPWLDTLSEHQHPGALLTALTLSRGSHQLAERMRPLAPFVTRILEGLLQSLKSGGRAPYLSPFGPFEADAPMLDGRRLQPGQTRFYQQLSDGETYVVAALPRKASLEEQSQLFLQVQEAAAQARRSFSQVTVMVTGEPAILTDELQIARFEALRCAGWGLLAVFGLLVLGFGQFSRPLCILSATLVSLCWSLGWAALWVKTLHLLSVYCLTILLALGIHFGIFLLAEYQLHRANGLPAREALRASLPQQWAQAPAALTTAAAFFSLHFSGSQAVAQLGGLAGGGLLLCYLSSLTVLPCLLLIHEGRGPCSGHPPYGRWLAPVEVWLRRRAGWLSLLGAAWTLASLGLARGLTFDYNLLQLHPPQAEVLRVESYLQRRGYSTLYALSQAPNVVEARQRAARLEKLPEVSRVDSIVSLEPRDVHAKGPLVRQLVGLAPKLRLPPPATRWGAFELLELHNSYLVIQADWERALESLSKDPAGRRLGEIYRQLQPLLDPGNPGPLASGLSSYQKALLADLKGQLQVLKQQKVEPPRMLDLLPEEVRLRGVADDGTVLLRIYPRQDCWERVHLERFLQQVRQVDPEVTGYPVLLQRSLDQLQAASSRAAGQTLALIALMLLLLTRSLRCATLALLPKLLGLVWMLGFIALHGQNLNAFNFPGLALTLGMGLMFGFESQRLCQAPGQPLMARQSSGFAMALSGLTSLVAFMILGLAEHRGVASLGNMLSAGVLMNLLSALLFLPLLYRFGRSRAWQR